MFRRIRDGLANAGRRIRSFFGGGNTSTTAPPTRATRQLTSGS